MTKKLILFFALASGLAFGQQSVWVSPSVTLQNAAVANGNGATLAVQGLGTVAVTVNCTVACTGGTTITFQVSQDGTNFVNVGGLQVGTTAGSGATIAQVVVNQGTAPTVWIVNVPGMQLFRTPVSSYSAGTITVTAAAVGTALSHLAALPNLKAVNTEQTAATNGNLIEPITDLVGKQIALPYANPENFVNGTGNATTTGSTQILAAEGSGVRSYVTSCQFNNTSSSATYVELEDGSTIITYIPVPASGGAVLTFPVPIRGTANTAFNFVTGASTTTMYVSCQGYKGQ